MGKHLNQLTNYNETKKRTTHRGKEKHRWTQRYLKLILKSFLGLACQIKLKFRV